MNTTTQNPDSNERILVVGGGGKSINIAGMQSDTTHPDTEFVEDQNAQEVYDPNYVEETRRWGNNKGHRSKSKRKITARIVRASKKRNRQ